MRIVRVVAMAVVALVALPGLAGAHQNSLETFFENFGQTSTEDRRGPSLAALRERSRHLQVGGNPAYELAGGCYALGSGARSTGWSCATATRTRPRPRTRTRPSRSGCRPPTSAATCCSTARREFLADGSGGDVAGAASEPSDAADWELRSARLTRGALVHAFLPVGSDRVLAVSPETGELILVARDDAGKDARFRFEPAEGCADYPEMRESTPRGKPASKRKDREGRPSASRRCTRT